MTLRCEIARAAYTERSAKRPGWPTPFRSRAEAEAAAVALYPTLAIRDIARDLDTTVAFVQLAAAKAGLPPRPVSMTPGQSKEIAQVPAGAKGTHAEAIEWARACANVNREAAMILALTGEDVRGLGWR